MKNSAKAFTRILTIIVILAVTLSVFGCRKPKIDRNEILNTLMTDIYSKELDAFDDIGLSDPSNVGIIESEREKVYYPVPADSEFAKIYKAEDCGFVEGLDAMNAKTNNKALRNLVTELKGQQGLKKVMFRAGTYCFSSALSISDVSDVYFCSDSPDKQFDILMTSWDQGFDLKNCKNIHFNNYNFDYKVPSTVSGTIVASSLNDKSITIKIDDEFDLSNSRYTKGKISYGSYMEFLKDETSGKYYPNIDGNLLYNSTGDQIKSITNGSYDKETKELKLTFTKIKRPENGTRVAVCYTMYEHFGFYAQNCENVYLESINLYHTEGMAIGAGSCKNLYLNKVNLALKEGSQRLVTATADGFHPANTQGEIVVTNCTFESSHDDCMNVKNTYQIVTRASGQKIYLTSGVNLLIEPGDMLDFYDDLNMEHVGTYTVDTVSNGYVVTLKETVPEKSIKSNFYVCNSSKTASLTIKNCYFGNKRNRGMLIQTRNVEISNCVFQNLMMGPINIFSTPGDIFHEGVMPKNVVVKNNKFLNCAGNCINVYTQSGSNLSSSGALENVEITDNYFNNNRDTPIRLLGTGNVNVKNNLIYLPLPNYNAIGIDAKTSEKVNIEGNRFYVPVASEYVDIGTKEVTELNCNDNYIIRVDENGNFVVPEKITLE